MAAADSLIQCIGSGNLVRIVQFRVKPGCDLLRAIEEAALSQGIRRAVIVSGLGALRRAVFRNLRVWPKSYPVRPEDRLYLAIERPMELVSLGGWLAPREDGSLEIHAHFSASMVEGDTVVTMGGHLTEGTVTAMKVVVALGEVDHPGMRAGFDTTTESIDLFL